LWLQKGHPVEAEAGNEKEKDKISVSGVTSPFRFDLVFAKIILLHLCSIIVVNRIIKEHLFNELVVVTISQILFSD